MYRDPLTGPIAPIVSTRMRHAYAVVWRQSRCSQKDGVGQQ